MIAIAIRASAISPAMTLVSFTSGDGLSFARIEERVLLNRLDRELFRAGTSEDVRFIILRDTELCQICIFSPAWGPSRSK